MNARNRLFIQHAIDSLQFVSDDQQHELNNLASLGLGSDSIGHLLQISRTVDTIERVCGELQSLLDQPPRLGGAGSGRSLSGPERALDRAA
jgi:hypothetical protein